MQENYRQVKLIFQTDVWWSVWYAGEIRQV